MCESCITDDFPSTKVNRNEYVENVSGSAIVEKLGFCIAVFIGVFLPLILGYYVFMLTGEALAIAYLCALVPSFQVVSWVADLISMLIE